MGHRESEHKGLLRRSIYFMTLRQELWAGSHQPGTQLWPVLGRGYAWELSVGQAARPQEGGPLFGPWPRRWHLLVFTMCQTQRKSN